MGALVTQILDDEIICPHDNDVSLPGLTTAMGQWNDQGTAHQCGVSAGDMYALHGVDHAAQYCADNVIKRFQMSQVDDIDSLDKSCLAALAKKASGGSWAHGGALRPTNDSIELTYMIDDIAFPLTLNSVDIASLFKDIPEYTGSIVTQSDAVTNSEAIIEAHALLQR